MNPTWDEICARINGKENAVVLFDLMRAVLHTLRLQTDDPHQIQALARIEKKIYNTQADIPEPEFKNLTHPPDIDDIHT